jgi:hypothetical protein
LRTQQKLFFKNKDLAFWQKFCQMDCKERRQCAIVLLQNDYEPMGMWWGKGEEEADAGKALKLVVPAQGKPEPSFRRRRLKRLAVRPKYRIPLLSMDPRLAETTA